jgi:hypothetical protein
MFQGDISLPKSPFRKAPKEVVVCMGSPLFRSMQLENQNNFSNLRQYFLQTVTLSIENIFE